jgi:hypothetical protein
MTGITAMKKKASSLDADVIIINTDGAAEPNPGPASIGAIIKDEKKGFLRFLLR